MCTVEEVEQLLLSLDTTKSSGCDGISATMLKETALSIAPGITKLFNTSIQTGVIPDAWKFSSIVPTPKGSKYTFVSNYRPISLLSILSKLLERHVYSLITDHLDANYPIALEQWGFQPRKLTVSALLDIKCIAGLKPLIRAKKSVLFPLTYRKL